MRICALFLHFESKEETVLIGKGSAEVWLSIKPKLIKLFCLGVLHLVPPPADEITMGVPSLL